MGAERWPAIVAHLEGEGELNKIGKLEEQVQACLEWYTKTFEALLTDNSLNLENINGIIPAIVFLGLDIKTLVSVDPTHEALVYNEARPNTQLWDMLASKLKKTMPGFARQTLAYLQWAYGEKDEKQWDIGSRPPVGKYAPSFRRGARVNGNRQERPERNDRSGNRKQSDRPPRKGNSKRRGPDKRANSDQKDQEKQALSEVSKAIEQLKGDTSLTEIKLKPANSFFRRLQHKEAIALGYESLSSGEGQDRSVVVKRAES